MTTPSGGLLAPRLDKPDFGSPERPRPDGEFATRLILDPTAPAAAQFLEQLEALHEDALTEGRRRFAALPADERSRLGALTENPLRRAFRDAETDAPTGEIVLRFGAPAGRTSDGRRPRRRRPAVFDSDGRPFWAAPVDLDSRAARISFRPIPYFLSEVGVAGLKLGLVAVMLTALPGAANASNRPIEPAARP